MDGTAAVPPSKRRPPARENATGERLSYYAELVRRLRPLRDRGIRLAIDDAGAGYASLHHIVQLRPDIIKIDRSLVHGIAGDPALRSIVTGFVALGRDLDATVVAEGVETLADLAAICDLGVFAAQGYALCRPTTDYGDLNELLGDGAITS